MGRARYLNLIHKLLITAGKRVLNLFSVAICFVFWFQLNVSDK